MSLVSFVACLLLVEGALSFKDGVVAFSCRDFRRRVLITCPRLGVAAVVRILDDLFEFLSVPRDDTCARLEPHSKVFNVFEDNQFIFTVDVDCDIDIVESGYLLLVDNEVRSDRSVQCQNDAFLVFFEKTIGGLVGR